MATIVPTVEAMGGGAVKVTWSGMGSGDDGAPFSGASKWPNKTVDVGGAAVTAVDIQGRNDAAGTYRLLNDSRGEGNGLTFAAADVREMLENPDQIRPVVTTGTTVKVVITMAKS